MRQSTPIKNRDAYTASPATMAIAVQNLIELILGLDFLQNGATAPTLATLITHTSTLKLSVGGTIETLVRFDDLFVLNILMKNRPFYLLPAGDNQVGMLNYVKLPVRITTDKAISLDLAYTGLATIDTEKISLSAIHGDVPQAARPYSIQYFSDTTSTADKEIDLSNSGKKLIGLLLFMTTIPTTTTLDASIGELKLKVNDKERTHILFGDMQVIAHDPEDTTIGGIADNYRYIDFGFLDPTKDSIPADKLKARFKSLSAATDAVRFIGIYE